MTKKYFFLFLSLFVLFAFNACTVTTLKNSCSVIFYLEDGITVYEQTTVNKGEELKLPQNHPRDVTNQEEFIGWGVWDGTQFSAEAYDFTAIDAKKVFSDMKFIALFREVETQGNKCSIVFYLEDGVTEYERITINKEEEFNVPQNEPRDESNQREFIGWGVWDGTQFSAEAYDFTANDARKALSDMKFRALFSEKLYTPVCR